jgi:NitT/TauT family transport system ATP-binding protein
MAIVCDRLGFSYGALQVFSSLSTSFRSGEVTAVLGPSGCGKTTLLQLIAGLRRPDQGRVELDGTEASGRVSFIFQEPRLLPWMTARGNVELVLERLRRRQERQELAADLLQRVGLAGFEDYYPHQLSGGMRQRVAVARAFAYPAALMLLDEPFQALDLRRKLSVMEAFGELWRREGRTTVLVTHDIQEALVLGDEIQLLEDFPARLGEVYRNPLPRGRRRLADERLISLEHVLYESLAGEGEARKQ